MATKYDERWKDRKWANKRLRRAGELAKETHPVRFANYYAFRTVVRLFVVLCIGIFVLHTTSAIVDIL